MYSFFFSLVLISDLHAVGVSETPAACEELIRATQEDAARPVFSGERQLPANFKTWPDYVQKFLLDSREFVDAQFPGRKAPDLLDHLSFLESQGVQFDFIQKKKVNAPRLVRIRQRGLPVPLAKRLPEFRWGLSAKIAFPRNAIEDPQARWEAWLTFAEMLATLDFERFESAPVFRSIPFGRSRWSFPETYRHRSAQAYLAFYTLLHAGRQQWQINPVDYFAKRGWWRRIIEGRAYAFEYGFLPLFPFFSASRTFRPHLSAYEGVAWELDGQGFGFTLARDRGRAQSRHRPETEWFATIYLRKILAPAVLIGLLQLPHLYHAVTHIRESPRFKEFAQEIARWTKPGTLNQALSEVGSVPIDPIVMEHYQGKIYALKNRIRTEGDPNGELATEIQKLVVLWNPPEPLRSEALR